MSLDTAAAFATLEAFMVEAGALALLNFGKAKQQLKPDKSMLTETDLAISELAQERLAPFLSQPGHVLIDEESIDSVGTPGDVFANSTYQWVLDPIDGTAAYAAGRDDWGIYLALLHNGEPVIAGMNQPGKGRLLLADTQTVWLVKSGERESLAPRQPQLGQNGFLHFIGCYREAAVLEDCGDIWPIADGGSLATMMEVMHGHSNGAVCQKGYGCLWDFAAAFAVAARLGFVWADQHTLQPITRLGAHHVTGKWKMDVATVLAPTRQLQPIADLLAAARQKLQP